MSLEAVGRLSFEIIDQDCAGFTWETCGAERRGELSRSMLK
jgi:hypothetical protein